MKKLWFSRKTYGWGWFPVTWQGWGVIGIYVLILIMMTFHRDSQIIKGDLVTTFIVPVIILTALLILVAYKTGEKPMWQWGQRKDD